MFDSIREGIKNTRSFFEMSEQERLSLYPMAKRMARELIIQILKVLALVLLIFIVIPILVWVIIIIVG